MPATGLATFGLFDDGQAVVLQRTEVANEIRTNIVKTHNFVTQVLPFNLVQIKVDNLPINIVPVPEDAVIIKNLTDGVCT